MRVETSFRLVMLSLLALFAVLVWVSGCSLLKVETSQTPDLPAQLQPSPILLEHERQADDWTSKAAGTVYEHGAEVKAPLVGQMREVVDARRVRTGLPAKPLESPQTSQERVKGADTLIKQLARDNEAYRAAESAWADQYEETRSTPVKKGLVFGAMSWLGSSGLWLAVAAVVACPTLLTVLGFVLKRVLTLKTAFQEVVEGVQELVTANADPEEAKLVLASHQGDKTEAEVKRAKKALGLPEKETTNES